MAVVPVPEKWDYEADVIVVGAGTAGLPAAIVAAEAGAKEFTVFHFSPRYTGQEQQMRAEARTAYETAVGKLKMNRSQPE